MEFRRVLFRSLEILAGRYLFLLRIRHDEATPGSVKVEQFSVTAPGHRGFHLAQTFFVAELLIQHVEEELLRHRVIALRFEGTLDLAQQEHVGYSGVPRSEERRVGKECRSGRAP